MPVCKDFVATFLSSIAMPIKRMQRGDQFTTSYSFTIIIHDKNALSWIRFSRQDCQAEWTLFNVTTRASEFSNLN
ncbi:hypothetical protein ACHAWC_006984 [Mediolabrus comicus]